MYNRYIPRSDGTYQRRRMQENLPPAAPPAPRAPQPPAAQPCPAPEPPKRPAPPQRPRYSHPRREPDSGGSIIGFLRQLLPKDFDAGDLMVVLLLLLMSGDCQEDQNTALLTLALYLFM